MKKQLLVITGRKRAEKDSAGNYLVEKYGFKKAQPLAYFKVAIADWFDFCAILFLVGVITH